MQISYVDCHEVPVNNHETLKTMRLFVASQIYVRLGKAWRILNAIYNVLRSSLKYPQILDELLNGLCRQLKIAISNVV